MMRSMTGFGQSEIATPDFTCVCRIKSVNNRYMQTNVRLDPPDEELEIRIRRVLQEFAARGSIDVNIRMQRSADANRYTFNDGLLKAIRPALDEAGAQVTLDGLLRAGILRLADGESLNSEEDIETILSCFRRAVADWNQSRCMEGASLARDMSAMLLDLSKILDEIATLDKGRIEGVMVKLRDRMQQLLQGQSVTEERLVEEAAYQAQRMDITEEIDRLRSHDRAMREALSENAELSSGKRIEFLIQELQREFNTIGSKAQEARMSTHVIDAKVLIEKLRQQAANIE